VNAEKTQVQVAAEHCRALPSTAEHSIHSTQLITWRSIALKGLTSLFTRQEKHCNAQGGNAQADYEARAGMGQYLAFYNHENHKRPHQALQYRTPAQV
jgi:hypothetical protein